MKATLLILLSALFITSPCLAEEYQYAEDPEVTQAFREQWEDVRITLERSAAIRAQHARERQRELERTRARKAADPLPPEWEVNPRYMSPPPPLTMPPPARMPMYIHGPHGEFWTVY